MAQRIGTYTLHVMNNRYVEENWDKENQEVIDEIDSKLSAAEEMLSDALPEHYYVKITDSMYPPT